MIVSSIGSMMTTSRMNNAAYSSMAGSDAMMGLVSFGAQNGGNMKSLLSAEQRLALNLQQSDLEYKINYYLSEAFKKLQDENIKRSFSTFA